MTLPFKPEGYACVTPYLLIRDATAAMAYYSQVFGAVEVLRMPAPDNKIGHAEMLIGDTKIMLADEMPDMDFLGPQSLGGTSVSLLLYTEDPDAVVDTAFEAGAEVLRPVMDQFYGDRSGTIRDPFGHVWTIACHIEDVDETELEKRREAFFQDSENP